MPEGWQDAALAEKWQRVRAIRGVVTGVLEGARREGLIGASLQAAPRLTLPAADAALLDAEELGGDLHRPAA